tara:strand:+ start:384 stop:614 length:231 start_codon:yes stop_codon:yes gene_type:complete
MANKYDDIKVKEIEAEEAMDAAMRKRYYEPESGETDYSATMSYEEYKSRIGPGRANGGMVKGFSPIARQQKFKGIF